ncbi:MAG: hypothetical protein HDR01_14890 [Lachnospiraceae bacterium]|nr:hypothetical protein [Lachnospiraceae bacterium]
MYKERDVEENRVVLCGANAYEKKYYFNEAFNGLPESIKEELHIIAVLFTEEVGGVFTIVFEADGSISLETDAAEEDILYDEISSGLLIGEIKRKRQELFESLSLYYKVFFLKEDAAALFREENTTEE